MKKIRLLIVLFMMFLMPMVALADDSYKFSFKMVKCDPNAEGMTAAKCRNNYLNGSLDSYIIENNGDLEPGSTIMLVGYLSLGTTKTATSFQTTIKYDSTNLTPLTTLKNGAITLLSASPRTADLPYYESEDDEGNIVNVTDWSISANQVDDTIKILADSGDSTMPLSSDLGYMYLFFEVSETATSGSSVSISYDGSAGVTEIADSSVPVNKLSFTVENSTYTVYGSQSGDNSLNTLTITNGSITYPITPQFEAGNSDITEYTAIVPNSISSVNLNATVNNSYAKIGESGLGEKTLSVGDNPFSIVVTAQNGDTETYYIHVYRLSDDATLSEITLTNDITVGTITDEVYVYTANIPYSTKNTNVSATTTHNNAFVESGTGDWTFTNSGDTINTKDIIVKAENCSEIYADVEGNECTSKTYTLNISREAASTNNYLSSLTVSKDGTTLILDPDFDKDTETYTLANVSNDTTKLTVAAVVEDTGKANIISGLGDHELAVGNNKIEVVVQAEDGSKKTYTVNVRRLSNNVKLQDLSVTSSPLGTLSPDFSSTFDGEYTYTYDPTVTDIDITATVEDTNNAKVSIVDVSDGSNPSSGGTYNTVTESFQTIVTKVAVVVTAEDGTVETYNINLNRLKSSNNFLSSLSISEGTLSPDFISGTRTYTASVSGDITSVDVTAVPAVSYAKVTSITGNTNLQFGLNTIEIVVEAEDGTPASYVINLTKEKYTNATLDDLTVNGVTVDGFVPADDTKLEYTISNVSFETTSLIISGTKTNGYSTVVGFDTVDLDTGDNKIIVSVTSHDGNTTNEYIINVYREKNDDNSVHGITVSGIVPTLNDEGQYEVTLPNNKTVLNPADVVISKSDDAEVIPGESISLSTKTVNTYTFEIKAENKETKQYTILITREPSSDASISRVNLTIGTDSSRFCLMENTTSCTINVPVETTSFSLEAIIHDEASVSPENDTIYTMDASESTKEITLTVTAEDGTTETYTVNVERTESSNNNLSDLRVNDTQVPNFAPGTSIYNVSVPGNIEDVTISATVEDTGKATIVTDLSKPFTLDFGRNQIDVVVKAENGQEQTYTIFVSRANKVDATLKDLTINGTTISGFKPEITEYTYQNVPYSTTALNIVATPNDENATATGDGLITLSTEDNTITIIVTAHDPSVTTPYVIHVYREKNDDTSLAGISLAGVTATFNSTTNNYEVTVPNSVTEANQSNLVVTVNDPLLETDAKATYTFTNTSLVTTNKNIIPITVKAEDGTEKVYNLVVTRTKSSVATLDDITVTNGSFSPSFNKDTLEYNVTVPVETTEFEVSAIKTDPNSTITSGVGHYTMGVSDMKVQIVVVSEDTKESNTYTLNISRTKSSINTLSSITVSHGTLDPEFSENQFSYTVNVDGSVEKIDIGATLSDARAEILYGTGSHDLEVGENTIVIRVKSEAGNETDYTIKVIRAKKSNNYLSNLKVNGETILGFNKETFEYTLDEREYEDMNLTIEATAEDADATVDGTGNKILVTGDNSFDIVVTAQNGVKRTYTINVKRKKNNNANLSVLSIMGYTLTPNFDADKVDYEVIVNSTKDTLLESDVTATKEDSNATMVKDGSISLSTTTDNYYKIVVTAEDGVTTKTYTIKVIRPKSSDATLSNVNLKDATLSPTFNKDKTEYTLIVPYGSASFEIEGIPSVSTTNVTGNGEYSASESVVTLTTLAEDGVTTKIYTFNIVEAPSNDATLSNLSINGYPLNKTFQSTILSYSIGNIPNNTTQLKVNATATNASSKIEYYVDGVKQDSNIVNIPSGLGTKIITVKVIAADGVTQKSYDIEYTVVKSSNAYLSILNPSEDEIDFNKTTYSYDITVANEITSVNFDITTEDSNATITVNNEVSFTPKTITVDNLIEGNNTLEILVTAEDGTTKTYIVTIKRLAPTASNDANLSALSVNEYKFDKTFNMDTLEYSIGNIPFSTQILTINATPNMGSSKITYLVNGKKQDSNVVNIPKEDGAGAITVQVKAEDGVTIKNYKITYSKTASSNAYLSNIVVSEGTLTFKKTQYYYEVEVGKDVTSIDITPSKEDQTSIMKINGTEYSSPHTYTISPLPEGNTETIILVTAEDGTVLTYKVVVKKETDILSTITSEEYGHTITNGYIRTVKLGITGIEMKNQLDNENQYLEIWTADESRKVEDNETLATGMIIKLIIDGEEKDRKSIVIKGDTNGDGEIDLFDAVMILNHYLEKTLLVDAYKEAGYVNDDEEIDLFDSVKILNHYLERELLH